MIRGQYTYRCDLCSEESLGVAFNAYMNQAVMNPDPPAGWIRVQGSLICDKHDVTSTTLAEALGFPVQFEDHVEFKPVQGSSAASS